MKALLPFAIAVTGTLSLFMDAASAELVVTQWSLGSVVNAPIDYPDDRQFFNVLQNPFQNSHIAIAGNTYVATAYDFSWGGDSGNFHVTSHQYMAQLDGEVSVSGIVYFTPSVDSILTMSIRDDYNWPSSIIGVSSVSLLAADFTENMDIYNQNRRGGNLGLGLPHGTLEIQASVFLTAGHDFVINYSSGTSQQTPSAPGSFGTADVTVDFSITPVPEPATATLIGILLFPRKPLDRRQQRR